MMAQLHHVTVQDGDDLIVVVQLSPSASDPGGEIAALGKCFRIVAHVDGPTLELIPLKDKPARLSHMPRTD